MADLRLVAPLPERDLFVKDGYVCERRTPAQCAQYDWSYEEWAALPQAGVIADEEAIFGRTVKCPLCDSGHWGAINPRGYLLVYRCHDGCSGYFRGVDGVTHDDAAVAAEIIFAALAGVCKTFVIRRLNSHSHGAES